MTSRRKRSRGEDQTNTRVEDANVPGEGSQRRPRTPVSGGEPPSRVASPPVSETTGESGGRQLAPVTLNVWLVASPHRTDQLAGFAAHARSRSLGPRTMPEWQESYEAFMGREVV